MRTLGILVVMAVLALSTSCGGTSDDPVGAGASDPAPSASEHPDDGLQTGDRSGPYDLVLRDVSVVTRDGHDRVVLSLDGDGSPGWAARFVDEAVLDGAGTRVALEGDTVLQLDLSGTPTLEPGRGTRVRESLGGDVVDVYAGEAYEGYTQVFLGLRGGRTPFEVSTRNGPSRLVIDLG